MPPLAHCSELRRATAWGKVSNVPSGGQSLFDILRARADDNPLNLIATAIFFLAIVHTFLAARLTEAAHAMQRRDAARERRFGRVPTPSVLAEVLLLLGEVEVVFGLWVVPLLVAATMELGWDATTRYVNDNVSYTEALFVVVIMALASTRPI